MNNVNYILSSLREYLNLEDGPISNNFFKQFKNSTELRKCSSLYESYRVYIVIREQIVTENNKTVSIKI
jgi:hypothetical protein